MRAWRRATGTDQHVLAERLGYDKSYISMIESGRRDVNDVAGRLRIARSLGVPAHRVGVVDTDSPDFVAMLQFAGSTIRLAVLARQAGQAAAAINELWPLVARLEARAADGMIERNILPLLVRARAELGVSLGYVLPEQRLGFAVRWTGRALRIAAHLDDPDLHAFCLRTHGNELRKAGRSAAATVRIAQAVALDTPQQRSPALLQLARVARDPATFDATFDLLQRSRDAGPVDDPMVTETAMLEVRLRGLLSTGRAHLAADIIDQAGWPPGIASPQWLVIGDITVAEVMFSAGSTATATPLLERAIAAATRLRLPHQIQRAQRVAQRHHPALITHAAQALHSLHGGPDLIG
ncbi:helix-turn-helix domain-containing protein [Dactylosporangium cerinum]|uniref:Helix-turn-helix domain-containing protein n=1 Tax=Dactylosporangium cerinum TaxID=1434730 RepID=A0ABV9WAW3_9ACTN